MKHSKRDLGFAIAVAFVCVTAGTPAFPAEKPPESGAVNEFTNASEVVSIDLHQSAVLERASVCEY